MKSIHVAVALVAATPMAHAQEAPPHQPSPDLRGVMALDGDALRFTRAADGATCPAEVDGAAHDRDADGRRIRQRLIDVAAREWERFGFHVTVSDLPRARSGLRSNLGQAPFFQEMFYNRYRRDPQSAAAGHRPALTEADPQMAPVIGGYWSVVGTGNIDLQNEAWRDGYTDHKGRVYTADQARAGGWGRDAWSAAFISWVACEGGFSGAQFMRVVAHRLYIDQAIEVTPETSLEEVQLRHSPPPAVYTAHDMGERPLLPGDLVCNHRTRGAAGGVAARRARLGSEGAMHCDIVVDVDLEARRVLTIGGNVGQTVMLTSYPLIEDEKFEHLHLGSRKDGMDWVTHLSLRLDTADAEALYPSFAWPTLPFDPPDWRTLTPVVADPALLAQAAVDWSAPPPPPDMPQPYE